MWAKLKASPYYPVAKGALVAAAGAALSHVAHWATGADVGPYGPVIGALCAFGLDAMHHLAVTADTTDPHDGDEPPPARLAA